MKNPCENCIVLPMCKLQVVTYSTIFPLAEKCSLLNEYLRNHHLEDKYKFSHGLFRKRLTELMRFYGLVDPKHFKPIAPHGRI